MVQCIFYSHISLRIYCMAEPGVVHRVPADTAPLSDPISVTRVLCGAMILPTIATIVGKIMFGKVESNFQRTLMVCINAGYISE